MRSSLMTLVGAAALVAATGCELDVPDLNDESLDELLRSPTRTKLSAAATGLLIASREDIALPNGYVSILGVLGRESYLFDPADPRGISELLEAMALNRGSIYGGAIWERPYRSVRNTNVVLAAVGGVVDMTPAEKEAIRGFAKTIAAVDYLRIINTRDELGAVIQRSLDPRALDPMVGKAEIFAHIATLLDEAKAHLGAGGDSFPFKIGSGFAAFGTPASLVRANRAIKARLECYRKDYPAALAALAESFLVVDPAAPQLELGIYHAYGTGTGDRVNRLIEPNHYAHPSIAANADLQPGGMPDARVGRKLKMVMSRTVRMLTSDRGFALYGSSSAPVPIIRNEELILLRAEANIGLGNLPAAIEDLNFVRVQAGRLAPRTDLTADNIVDELLKQRVYSLLFEGGHRWIDARRFGRLAALPLDRPEHHVHSSMPIPLAEADARAQ